MLGHIHARHEVERVWFDGLQGAYERTVVAGGEWWDLVQVMTEFVFERTGGSRKAQGGTLLVSAAAAVGGLRDEERRRAVKVLI